MFIIQNLEDSNSLEHFQFKCTLKYDNNRERDILSEAKRKYFYCTKLAYIFK